MSDLVEREAALAALQGALAAAAQGGRIALVAGEAGIGKTSVLRALAAAHDGAVWWGACDALETPLPLAPLLDMARDAGARFGAALGGPRPALFDAVLAELSAPVRPVLVVVEDAHWADDATLDWLKFVGRRIARTHALLAVSFRDDEVGPTHPLRRVLGELPPSATVRVTLPRLSAQGVAQLARRAARPAAGVHAATGGNPFFVTEVLRDGGDGVPRSVQDVVLARFARLPEGAQRLVQAVSLLPGRCERWLADALAAPTLADTEAALASGLLVADGAWFSFRHELGRVAVEGSLSAPQAQALHAQVLGLLADPARATDPARLVHHAVHANDTAAISRHAPQAAEAARQRGALREWGAHWRVAVEQGRPRDDDERIAWLENYARAAATNTWSAASLKSRQTLESLYRERGAVGSAAVARAMQCGPLTQMLRHEEARAACRDALAMVAPLPEGPEVAAVWSVVGWQFMLDRDHADAIAWGRRAIPLAERLGETTTLERAVTATGAALLFVDFDEGQRMLLDLADRRRAAGNRMHVAYALAMLGSGSGELMHLSAAEALLREAAEIFDALDMEAGYSRAWRALCLLGLGRWDEAATDALYVTSQAGRADTAMLMACVALARLRLRRGDPGLDEMLATARRLAEPSGTLQRLAPCASLVAEAALQRGDSAAAVAAVQAVLPLARAKGHPWFVGELSYWLWRAGEPVAGLEGCAEPYALQIAGRWQVAADAWQRLGCPYERARALADGDAAAQREAVAAFDALGARPAAEAVRRRLREAGERGVARGARPTTRRHPAGLTAAESQVLALMAQGLRNADIAARLHRSVRTVDHHVAAVLAKLAVDSRGAAVQRAQREGWLQSGQPGGEI